MFGFGKFSRQEFEGDILGLNAELLKKMGKFPDIAKNIFSTNNTAIAI